MLLYSGKTTDCFKVSVITYCYLIMIQSMTSLVIINPKMQLSHIGRLTV